MKNKPSTHVLIAALILVIAIACNALWYAHVTQTSAHAGALQSEINGKESVAGRALAAREALGSLTKEGSSTTSHFVSEKDVVPFLEEIQAVGTSVGTKTTVVSVAADTNVDNPSIRLSLSLVGTFDSVMRAVGLIEHSPYALRTEMFDIKADDTGSSWSAHMILLASTPLAATSTPQQ